MEFRLGVPARHSRESGNPATLISAFHDTGTGFRFRGNDEPKFCGNGDPKNFGLRRNDCVISYPNQKTLAATAESFDGEVNSAPSVERLFVQADEKARLVRI
jgi:hypothetical protein